MTVKGNEIISVLTCGSSGDIWEYRACLLHPHVYPISTDLQLIMAFPDPRAQNRIGLKYGMFTFCLFHFGFVRKESCRSQS